MSSFGVMRGPRRDEPWPYREVLAEPSWWLEDMEGIEYWPTPQQIHQREQYDRIAAMQDRIAELEAAAGAPTTATDKLKAAQRLITGAIHDWEPLDEQLRKVRAALASPEPRT